MGLAVLVLALATQQGGFQCVWRGTGFDNLWSNPANWTGCGGTHPFSGDTLVFPHGVSHATSVNDLVGLVVESMTVSGREAPTSFGDWHITGNQILLKHTLDIDVPVHHLGGSGRPRILLPIKGDISTGFAPTISVLGTTEPELGDIDLGGVGIRFHLTNGSLTVSGHITGTKIASNDSIYAVEVDGNVQADGHVHTLTLNDNSFTGQMRIGFANVRLLTDRSLGASGEENRTSFGSPGSLELGPGISVAETLSAFTGVIKVPAGSSTLTGMIRAFHIRFVLGGELTVAGILRLINNPEGGFLTQEGGTLTLMNPENVAFNDLRVFRGTLRAGHPMALSGFNRVVLSQGTDVATLDVRTKDTLVKSLSGAEGGRIVIGSSSIASLILDQGFDATYNGTIAGTGTFVKRGVGDFSLRGPASSTFTGLTRVEQGGLILAKSIPNAAVSSNVRVAGGRLTIGLDEQIPDGATVTIDPGGVLTFVDQQLETITALAGSGAINVGRGTLTMLATRSSTFDGSITGARLGSGAPESLLRLIKKGLGTFTLTGTSHVGDTIALDAGVLTIDGAVDASALLVRGGTLNGTGRIVNNVPHRADQPTVLMTGGTLAPGHGHAGILRADGVRIDAGMLLIRLEGAGPGIGYNQLALTGNLMLAPAARLIVERTFAVPQGSRITVVDLAPGLSVVGTFSGLPEGKTFAANGQTFRITYRGGVNGNDVVLTAVDGPPLTTYYLSEGYTGGLIDEDLHFANPHDIDAPVTMTFVLDSGARVEATTVVPAMSHRTVHVDQIPGLENTGVSTIVRSDKGLPIGIERTMLWDADHYAATGGTAIDRLSEDWFFAEGGVDGNGATMNTFLALLNPSATAPATVTVTFLLNGGQRPPLSLTLDPMRRWVVDIASLGVGNHAFGMIVHATQPIAAERSVYHGGELPFLPAGGSTSAGVTVPATQWFFGDGHNGPNHRSTYFLVANPQDTPAHLTLRYQVHLFGIENVVVQETVPARSRLTIRSDATEDPRLKSLRFATTVTADVPVVVERTTYWRTTGDLESAGGAGVVEPGTKWLIPHAQVGQFLRQPGLRNELSWIFVRNPNPTMAFITATTLRENGPPIVETFTLSPDDYIDRVLPLFSNLQNEAFGLLIESTNGVPITVERTLYWDAAGIEIRGGTHVNAVRLP